MGSDYWGGLFDWMKEKMLRDYDYISEEDFNIFTVVDEPKAAARIIVDFKKAKGRAGLELPSGMTKS